MSEAGVGLLAATDPAGTMRHINLMDAHGDRLSIFANAGTLLGQAISDALNLLGIRCVVIGGGVAPALQYMEAAIRAEVEASCFTLPPGGLDLRAAACGNDAGVLGAARLALLEPGR